MKVIDRVRDKMIALEKAGFTVEVIGGAVRDNELGVEPHDWDLFTNATGEEIMKVFPDSVPVRQSEPKEGEEEKIALTIMVGDEEVSTYRGNGNRTKTGITLPEHQKTCDCTMNAIAVNKDGELVGDQKINKQGLLDIKNGIIRAVGSPLKRFKEDPLRIMRFIRLLNKYGFTIHEDTLKAMHDHINLLNVLPVERIREEYLKIITYGLNEMKPVLNLMCPQLISCFDIDGGCYHKETVGEHNFRTYEFMLTLTDNPLKLTTALFHDIGKYFEVKVGPKGNTFHYHEKSGEDFMKEWMTKFLFSHDDIKYVTTMIGCHMYDTSMYKRGYLKLFKKLDDNNVPVEDLLMLRYADSRGNVLTRKYKYGDMKRILVKKYYKLKYSGEPFSRLDLKINGYDIKNEFGYEGQDIGKIIQLLLEEVQYARVKNSQDQLMLWVKNYKEGQINASRGKNDNKDRKYSTLEN